MALRDVNPKTFALRKKDQIVAGSVGSPLPRPMELLSKIVISVKLSTNFLAAADHFYEGNEIKHQSGIVS
jgi:hypothetical protein